MLHLMKIGIDGRLIYQTGVGRYIQNIVKEFGLLDTRNEYVLFVGKDAYGHVELPNSRWHTHLITSPWHSISEQIQIPLAAMEEKLDVFHIPYFTVPVLYPGRIVVTIHDLIILHYATGKASTLPKCFYWFKYIAYRMLLWISLHKAQHIIAVSETTKKDIMDNFCIPDNKISVTYEGVDDRIKQQDNKTGIHADTKISMNNQTFVHSDTHSIIPHKYFLYVGNAYPHKNLEFLIDAFNQSFSGLKEKPSLVFVGKDDFFYKRLRGYAEKTPYGKHIIFYGYADDATLQRLYTQAIALVIPSLSEGFGLPPLEALSLGCPVIVSDIPIFHEILGISPSYFALNDVENLSRILLDFWNKSNRGILKREHADISRYSWIKTAKQTLYIYEHSTRIR